LSMWTSWRYKSMNS